MSDLGPIVKRLVGAGAEPAVAASCVVEAYEAGRNVSADVQGQSVDERRKRDRLRKQADRAAAKEIAKNQALTKVSSEANDAGATVVVSENVHGPSTDSADKRCVLSSLLTEDDKGIREVSKKEAGSEIVALAKRGTRLRSDAPLSDADRQFAIDHGCPDPDVAWAEFVDFWTGIPGQRGTKLNWPGTWRNRVRDKFSKTGGLNGRGPRLLSVSKPSLADRALDLADEARRRELAAGLG